MFEIPFPQYYPPRNHGLTPHNWCLIFGEWDYICRFPPLCPQKVQGCSPCSSSKRFEWGASHAASSRTWGLQLARSVARSVAKNNLDIWLIYVRIFVHFYGLNLWSLMVPPFCWLHQTESTGVRTLISYPLSPVKSHSYDWHPQCSMQIPTLAG